MLVCVHTCFRCIIWYKMHQIGIRMSIILVMIKRFEEVKYFKMILTRRNKFIQTIAIVLNNITVSIIFCACLTYTFAAILIIIQKQMTWYPRIWQRSVLVNVLFSIELLGNIFSFKYPKSIR